MSPRHVVLRGTALHAGVEVSALLAPHDGPTILLQGDAVAVVAELRVERADRGVCVTDPTGRMRVDLVEHLFAAIGALGLDRGLQIRVDGPELPLLDGGASAWVDALRDLGLERSEPHRRIVRGHSERVGDAVYEFEPGDRVCIQVEVQFDHPLIAVQQARWDGDEGDFAERVAPARTFGFMRDAQALRETSRARGVNTRDVVVLCEDGTTVSEPPPSADECVRHKLLDVVGDLTISGGLLRGTLRARCPGHRATHEVMARVRTIGVIAEE